MQAYKLKGKIDQAGHLIITESIELAPGDVEVIILQSVEKVSDSVNSTTEPPSETTEIPNIPCRTKIFRDWLAAAKPVPPDFDADLARWEALQEKYL